MIVRRLDVCGQERYKATPSQTYYDYQQNYKHTEAIENNKLLRKSHGRASDSSIHYYLVGYWPVNNIDEVNLITALTILDLLRILIPSNLGYGCEVILV